MRHLNLLSGREKKEAIRVDSNDLLSTLPVYPLFVAVAKASFPLIELASITNTDTVL